MYQKIKEILEVSRQDLSKQQHTHTHTPTHSHLMRGETQWLINSCVQKPHAIQSLCASLYVCFNCTKHISCICIYIYGCNDALSLCVSFAYHLCKMVVKATILRTKCILSSRNILYEIIDHHVDNHPRTKKQWKEVDTLHLSILFFQTSCW